MTNNFSTRKTNLVNWSPTFACGIQLVDEQHKSLIDMINDMYNHVSGNPMEEREYFNSVIQKAVNYIKIHFATEEKLMIATKFSGYAKHRREHELFILKVIEKNHEFNAATSRLTLSDFIHFLKDWVLSHVAVVDKVYFNYFRAIATRKADGKLSITSADVR